MLHASRGVVALTVLAALGGGTAGAAGVSDPLERPALTLRTPAKAMLLALAAAAGEHPRLVAAGERGIVVFSDDQGRNWRQAKVPVAVTLTALGFPTAQQGWAVGHGGVVLHTADGGETWTKQLDGIAAARIADAAARVGSDAALQRRTAQLVGDGPDKPFMAAHFVDARHGFIVGAYGLIFGTEDGGATWTSWLDRVDNPRGLHLNAIGVDGDTIYLAGEQGLLLRSDDGGKRFSRLASPYQGSFFAAVADRGTLVIAGLKGNVFRSEDRGEHLNRIEGVPPVSIVGGQRLTDGRLLFVNQAGQLLASRDNGRSLESLALPANVSALAAEPLADGNWIVVGARGAVRTSSAP